MSTGSRSEPSGVRPEVLAVPTDAAVTGEDAVQDRQTRSEPPLIESTFNEVSAFIMVRVGPGGWSGF